MLLRNKNRVCLLAIYAGALFFACPKPTEREAQDAVVIDLEDDGTEVGWVTEPEPSDEPQDLDAGKASPLKDKYCPNRTLVGSPLNLLVTAGTSTTAPLGVLTPGCHTVIAIGTKHEGLSLRLKISFPTPDAGFAPKGMPPLPFPFPAMVLALAEAEAGKHIVILGGKTNCFRNPMPLPIPTEVELNAKSGSGPVKVLLCSEISGAGRAKPKP